MHPKIHAHKIFLIAFLSLVIFSPLLQSAGAPPLFDPKVTLSWKATPALRAALGQGLSENSRRMGVLVVVSNGLSQAQLEALRSVGTIETLTNHVVTMNLLPRSLPQLASLNFVQQISMPKILRQQLDVSVPEILADRVWNTTKYPGARGSDNQTIDGSGVIIGIADSGIDYLHKDFYFRNGTSKILYIWDQTVNGRHPNGYDYGNECDPVDIRTLSCSETDSDAGGLMVGHGTAVTAVAASSGQASHKYSGVAPGASIIAVKLADGSEDHVLDATNYLIMKARQLKRPIVIDHSLGDSLGSHDGTEALELAMTDFVAQGVPIVVASGNERNKRLHITGELLPGQPVHVPWSIVSGQSFIDLWYPISSLVALSVVTPTGQVVAGPTPDVGTNTANGNVIILADKRSSGREWWVNVTANQNGDTPIHPWSLILTPLSAAAGKWDAWIEPGQFDDSNDSLIKRLYSVDPSDTIDAPGTAIGVITVGGYMTKATWLGLCTPCIRFVEEGGYENSNIVGIWSTKPPLAPSVGDLAYSSGVGPTRDGRIKPEIVAPIGNVAAARAYTARQRYSDPDDHHQTWRGTSFAAPHVVGVIALMLQMNPYLSPNEIKNILKDNAREDAFTGKIDKAIGSPLWGWGKVNALKSTLDAPSLYSVRLMIYSIGEPLVANLTLDGQSILKVPLNVSKTIILEFKGGERHTLDITPALQIGNGSRYAILGSQWIFSSGGVRNYQYRLQYFLEVRSEFGHTTGTGWYDANSTAAASVVPVFAQGHRFEGWIGSVSSDSPTVQLKMDSSKQLVATWRESGVSTESFISALVAISLVSVAVAFIIRRTYTRGTD